MITPMTDPTYEAGAERAVISTVAGLDWNCQQHIIPRWTEEELAHRPAARRHRLLATKAENAQLRRFVPAQTPTPDQAGPGSPDHLGIPDGGPRQPPRPLEPVTPSLTPTSRPQ